MPQQNIESQFLDETKEVDNLTAPLVPQTETPADTKGNEPEGDEDDADDSVKNRRHRRLEAKLQAEREANIAMAAKLEVISESRKFRDSTDASEYVKAVEKIYGTNSPEASEATNLLATALKGVEERATERALELFREEQQQAQQAVRHEEEVLESMIDEIEDSHSVSFTPAMERSFFKLLEKMSPKDEEGNVIAYADPEAVYEVFSERTSKPNTRARDIASRSMAQGGSSSGDSKLQDDATLRALKDMGII